MSKRGRAKAAQRERILDAARSLFAERGFDDVTVSEIATKSAVARGTIFNHFQSKHGMIEAITGDVVAYYAGLLDQALAAESTPVPQLVRALFSYMGAGIESSQTFYRGAFREIVRVQVGLESTGTLNAQQRKAQRRLAQLLERGQERGEIESELPPAELARIFDAISNGTITSWLYEDSADSLQQRMERASEVFLRGTAVRAADARNEARDGFHVSDFVPGTVPTAPHRGEP